jgi:hypothetical protein
VIANRPTRSADGAVGLPVDTASVLGVELCLPGSGGDVTSRYAMSSLQEAGGNARWLLSQCPRCIADGSARRAGRLFDRRIGSPRATARRDRAIAGELVAAAAPKGRKRATNSAAYPVPCRTGKLREKIFSWLFPRRKAG